MTQFFTPQKYDFSPQKNGGDDIDEGIERMLQAQENTVLDEQINNINFNSQMDETKFEELLQNKSDNRCCNEKCNSGNIHYDRESGGYVCGDCGEYNGAINNSNVQGTKIGEKEANRCNTYTNTQVPNVAQKTFIKGVSQQSLLGKIHRWSEVTYKNKNMYRVWLYINKKFKDLVDKAVCQHAFNTYRKIYKKQLFRGSVRKGIIGSCVYESAKEKGVCVNIDEIANILQITKKIVLKAHKILINILHTSNISGVDTNQIITPTPTSHIDKYCELLNISDDCVKIVSDIVIKLEKMKLALENNPKTVVTSCIFLISCVYGLGITKKQIANVCNISEVTIYKCYTRLLTSIDELLDITKLDTEQLDNLNKLKTKKYKRRRKKTN